MIRLLDLAHERARDALGTGAPVYVLVNPVEYHGPHLSLHNDRLVSTALARELHERLSARHPSWPFLLADDLEVGVDPCPGPGTRHTTMPAACGVIREACRALVELGAQRVVFMTFHGSPLACATAIATIDALRAGRLVERSASVGATFLDGLRSTLAAYPSVQTVRGRGLMIGIELSPPGLAMAVARELLGSGYIVLTGGTRGDVLTLTPPLSIEERLLDGFTAVLSGVLEAHTVREPSES